MKYILLHLMLSFILCNALKAQIINNTKRKDTTNIYNYSLLKYAEILEKKKNEDSIYIEYSICSPAIDSLINHASNKRILKVNISNCNCKRLIRIIPLRLEEDIFYVTFIYVKVEKKGFLRKKVTYYNSGGVRFKYKYDNDIKSFIYLGYE